MPPGLPSLIQIMLHKVVAVAQAPFGPYNRLSSILLLHLALSYAVCDVDFCCFSFNKYNDFDESLK